MVERQELENRLDGHLRKLLNGPLQGESPEELERLVQRDELGLKRASGTQEPSR
jgi:hypothetical protein